MSDGFGAIRSRVSSNSRHSSGRASEGRRFSRLTRAPRLATAAAGRWSLVPTAEAVALTDLAAADRDELAEAVAELLLHRWGVLFRDLVVHDSLRFPWRDLQWALRRLEDRGLVRGGRFVSGFSGEQYALPAAHEQLTQVRRAPREGERVTVNATDPHNLVGVIIPGVRVPAVRTRRVTFVDGVMEGTVDVPELAEARSA
jgi:ATP-dependent Lhr-like helicase